MGMRQTSIDAYNKIRSEGLLSTRRFEVYDYIFKHGPCTAKDVIRAKQPPGTSGGTYTSRFSELERLGVIKDIGTVKCKHTGLSVTLWETTDNLPKGKIKTTQGHSRKHLEKCREVLIKVWRNNKLPHEIKTMIESELS